MLVLSRQRDEIIMIGDDIQVQVVDIRGDKVRLGITAPKAVSVHRKEVYDAIRRENRAAASIKPQDLGSFLGKVVHKEPGEEKFDAVVELPLPPAKPPTDTPSLVPAPPTAQRKPEGTQGPRVVSWNGKRPGQSP